jgi:hypothetical protein
MAVEHRANPDANLRAFAQRGDHRAEPAQQRMRIALLRADIDLSCAEAARLIARRTKGSIAAVEKPQADPSSHCIAVRNASRPGSERPSLMPTSSP